MTKLPVTRVDSTVLPVSFFDLDSVGLQGLSTGIWSREMNMCVVEWVCATERESHFHDWIDYYGVAF